MTKLSKLERRQELAAIDSDIAEDEGAELREPRERLSGTRAMCNLFIGTALIVGTFASPASADWWIVRSSDGTCLVVDIEPTDKDRGITKIGKDAYPTAAKAEADVKRLCQESEAAPKDDTSE